MIPQKREGRLFIVLPTLEDMLSFCKDSKMKAQVAGMEYSNFRKHCRMQTDLRIDTYTKCASAFDMDVLLLHLPKGMIESLPQFGLRSPPFYSDYSPQRFFRPCFRPKIYCFTQVNLEKCELFHFCFSLHLKLHIDRGFCIVESISRHSCQKVYNKI